jgi:hypothetical protein
MVSEMVKAAKNALNAPKDAPKDGNGHEDGEDTAT